MFSYKLLVTLMGIQCSFYPKVLLKKKEKKPGTDSKISLVYYIILTVTGT